LELLGEELNPMIEKKPNPLYDSTALMKIFATLSETEKAVAIAYALGWSGRPLDTLFNAKSTAESGATPLHNNAGCTPAIGNARRKFGIKKPAN
jgi:hypothetical protein